MNRAKARFVIVVAAMAVMADTVAVAQGRGPADSVAAACEALRAAKTPSQVDDIVSRHTAAWRKEAQDADDSIVALQDERFVPLGRTAAELANAEAEVAKAEADWKKATGDDAKRLEVRLSVVKFNRDAVKRTHERATAEWNRQKAIAEAANAKAAGVLACRREWIIRGDESGGPYLARLDAILAKVGADIARMESLVAQARALCLRARTDIPETTKNARQLVAAIDKLTTEAGMQRMQSGPTAATGVQNAGNAAAAIAELRKHAAEAAQSACKANEAVQAAPRGDRAAVDLAEAKRQQTAVEQDVVQAAAKLKEIQAAIAAQQTPVDGGFVGRLRALQAQAPRVMTFDPLRQPMSDYDTFSKAKAGASNALSEYEGAWGDAGTDAEKGAAKLREGRYTEFANRYREAIGGADCLSEVMVAVPAMLRQLGAIEEALKNAETGVIASGTDVDQQGDLQKILATAQADAASIAMEVTNAVRCAGAAQTAMPSPPSGAPTAPASPQPSPPPGASALPPAQDFGDKNADFTGRWVDHHDQFWTFTISNGKTARFAIAAQSVHRGSANFDNKWSGACARTEVNKAVCSGTGTYEDDLRVMSFAVRVVMYVHDGGILNYNAEYTSVALVRMKIPGQKPTPGGISTDIKPRQSLKKG
ncbi:MAG: hypothetical protein ACT4O6_24380 [Reyranella sp.]